MKSLRSVSVSPLRKAEGAAMKIIYMGTPDFAVAPLRALIGAGHELLCVLTQGDKPRGRGQALHMPPVKEAALEAGIPVLQPENMRDPALLETLRGYGAELFVVAAFGRMLPKELLTLPRYGCVNIHASLLPDYRGAAPIQWAVIDGRKESGITTMQMNEGLDTGDILRQYRLTLTEDETGGSLFDRLTALGAEAILDTVRGLEEGSIIPRPQGEPGTAYAAMLTKGMGNIDWSRPAAELERRVRGLSPWPGCYSFLNGRMIKLWKTRVMPSDGRESAEPGTVCAADDGGLIVQTGEGRLIIDELQPEGKKRMESSAYLRGAKLREGMHFQSSRS